MRMSSAEISRTAPELCAPVPPLTLTATEFATIATMAREEFGLELGAGKEQLVAARIGKVARKLGFRAFRDYYEYVTGDRSGEALIQLIDALTTNHTSFFRERAHFDFLVREILVTQRGRNSMWIWSAACSTGEEPYSIALTAREALGADSRALPRILATDISTRALGTACRGIYSAERFHGEPAQWLRKYLLRGEGKWEGHYRMRPEVVGMVTFDRLNLIEPMPEMGPFAVIFCRNVMIYFSRATQQQLVSKLASRLEPGGYLFVGHSEGLTGIQHDLQQIQPAIYRKRGERR